MMMMAMVSFCFRGSIGGQDCGVEKRGRDLFEEGGGGPMWGRRVRGEMERERAYVVKCNPRPQFLYERVFSIATLIGGQIL